jgi:serine/threonine protein kinase
MSESSGTGPTSPLPPHGSPTDPGSSMWGQTAAVPTEPAWASLPAHRALGPADPREVGGYRLRALLGEGGMGRVYLSYTPGGRPVAIKVVRGEYAADPAFRRRFEQEIHTAQRVQGLYTAPVIDAGPQAPQPWLATAYVPGPSLQHAVGAYGPLPPETVLILVAGVAEALQSIHAVGVVHRDLKPSNVILASDGPRVIDFGIARAVDSTSVTRTGVRPGTPAYMAPEHIRGEQVTAAADLFALGVLAHFAATGELAFGGGMDPAVPYRILEQEPNLTNCPEQLRDLVTRCLAKDPAQRPDPTEVIRLCREASTTTRLHMGQQWLPPNIAAEVHRIAAAPVPPAPAEPAPPKRRGRIAALAVAGVVLLVATTVVITAYLSGAFDREQPTGQPGASNQTTSTPPETPADRTTEPTTESSTSAPSTVPKVGSGPGSKLGSYDSINIALGYAITFDQPTSVSADSSGDLYYYEYGSPPGLAHSGEAVILEAGVPATYQSCIEDTRYVTDDSAIASLPQGAAFCVLTSGRVALVQIKKVPDKQLPSQYYEIALTLWQGPSS